MAFEGWLGASWFGLGGKTLESQLYLFCFIHQILLDVLSSNLPKEITYTDSSELTTNYYNSSFGS